jgi:hypothetical protein
MSYLQYFQMVPETQKGAFTSIKKKEKKKKGGMGQ